jgi:peptidoglycan hydrolase-like protein with peptidoglycan-binding domain
MTAFAVGALMCVLAACGGSSSSSTSTTKPATSTTTPGGYSPTAIKDVQKVLAALNCQPGPIDGELGPDTVGAIKRFQTAAGLTVDGVVGVETRAALGKASSSGSPECKAPSPTTSTTAPLVTASCSSQGITPYLPASITAMDDQWLGLVCATDTRIGGLWAAFPATTVAQNPQDPTFDIVVLFHTTADGKGWFQADRGTYCTVPGALPPTIFQAGCTTS